VISPVLLLGAPSLVAAGLRGATGAARTPALAAALALAAGCAASTVAVARDVQVAPRARLAELKSIAGRIAGQGPTIVLDYEIYAARHFLRDADPEGATDLRYRQVARSSGGLFDALTIAEVDDVANGRPVGLPARSCAAAARPPAARRASTGAAGWAARSRSGNAGPAPRRSDAWHSAPPSTRRLSPTARARPHPRRAHARRGRAPPAGAGAARPAGPRGRHGRGCAVAAGGGALAAVGRRQREGAPARERRRPRCGLAAPRARPTAASGCTWTPSPWRRDRPPSA